VGPATAQAEPEAAQVRTAATATRSVRPDLATLTLRFSAVGLTPGEAGRHLAARTDSLRRALVAIGIPRDSVVNGSRWYWWQGRVQMVQTQRCDPRPDGRGCVPYTDTTYRALEALTVRIRDLDRIGVVIDTALAHAITEIGGPQFTASDTRAAHTEALREATASAREQAQAIAEAGGGRLGRILFLGTSSDRTEYYGPRESSLTASAGDGPGSTFIAPSVTVSATVYTRWELRERP
jgi:hypothetical protein